MTAAGGNWRGLRIPALTTAAMLALACYLGVWQLHRLAWKTEVLASIARAEAGPAVPLPADPPKFAKGQVQGKWLADAYALYGADIGDTPAGRRMGARLIMALQRDGGAPLLVDRGWVPIERVDAVATPDTAVALEGYVRLPDRPGWFAAEDDPGQRRFFTLDPAAIGPSLGLPKVAPFVLVALGPRMPGVYPQPAQKLPRPANDHLAYAITWFGLALTLVVIFLLYCRKVLRA